MGNPDRAKVNLAAATRITPKYRMVALEDPDLEPIWILLTD
ncbi:MAG: hypothetical protein ABIO87_02305 [Chthoniobacterales bacterium]